MSLSVWIPEPVAETGAATLEFERLREMVAGYATSSLGRERIVALVPSGQRAWIAEQQQRVHEIRMLLVAGVGFEFYGLFDASELLEKTRIDGVALETEEIRSLLTVIERVAAWRSMIVAPPAGVEGKWPAIEALSEPLRSADFDRLLRYLRERMEPDGTISETASPELRRIRREMDRQHRLIEDGLRATLRKLSEGGTVQDDLITIRGERFVIPVKAEWKRRIPGVVHGASSSGQTVYLEPLETIEQNNELVRMLEEEQEEIHRILVGMTREIGLQAMSIAAGVEILAEVESLFARARFGEEYGCVAPVFAEPGEEALDFRAARHPLLERRLRSQGGRVVPLTLALGSAARELVISGPNTGGKTVALKTIGLLALMAQAGMPVPAEAVVLPVFDAVLADIGDAQSIEQNLSTFSAHLTNLDRISRLAGSRSLVLLDELGSATDPEEGAALAAAIAEHFLQLHCWCLISTHHTSMKVYAANTPGVVNAAAGFDQQTLAPTYELRMGVPGASAGINIAARLGLNPAILEAARGRLQKQTEDIGRFLDQLHTELREVTAERETLRRKEQEVARERSRLEYEGMKEQRLRVRELEVKLDSLMKDFEYKMRETVRAIDDRAAQQKLSKEAERRMLRLRREFSEQFNSTVVAHRSGADKGDPQAQPHIVRHVSAGDTVRLKSLGKPAVVQRQIDENTFEVAVGLMKMRIARDDIAQVTPVAAAQERGPTPLETARRSRGISISTSRDEEDVTSEINVIGYTVDEATTEVEKFLDRAFLAGLPRIRVVHGSGMGVLRKALRSFFQRHPQVALVTEPPQSEGGSGATVVDLKL